MEIKYIPTKTLGIVFEGSDIPENMSLFGVVSMRDTHYFAEDSGTHRNAVVHPAGASAVCKGAMRHAQFLSEFYLMAGIIHTVESFEQTYNNISK